MTSIITGASPVRQFGRKSGATDLQRLTREYFAPSTFLETPPAWAKRAHVIRIGGGASGQSSGTGENATRGGYSGEIVENVVELDGAPFSVTIGAGGVSPVNSGATLQNGVAGGDTTALGLTARGAGADIGSANAPLSPFPGAFISGGAAGAGAGGGGAGGFKGAGGPAGIRNPSPSFGFNQSSAGHGWSTGLAAYLTGTTGSGGVAATAGSNGGAGTGGSPGGGPGAGGGGSAMTGSQGGRGASGAIIITYLS